MKKHLYLAGFIMLAILIGISGCSKSSKSTSSNLTPGDPQDPGFALAKPETDTTIVELNDDAVEDAEWIISGEWEHGAIVVDTVSYDSLTGWHLRLKADTTAMLQFAVADSFRFTDMNNQYTRFRDSTTNIFERRFKKTYTFERHGGPDTNWIKIRNRNIRWVGLVDTVSTLNGDFYRRWFGDNDHRIFNRVINGTLTDLKFYNTRFGSDDDRHPFAGTLTASIVLDVQNANNTVHVDATLTITFFPDHYHAELIKNGNVWQWDHFYHNS